MPAIMLNRRAEERRVPLTLSRRSDLHMPEQLRHFLIQTQEWLSGRWYRKAGLPALQILQGICSAVRTNGVIALSFRGYIDCIIRLRG